MNRKDKIQELLKIPDKLYERGSFQWYISIAEISKAIRDMDKKPNKKGYWMGYF